MFGKKLDVLMRLLDISNTQLANAVYLDPSYISRLRSGKRKLPKNKGFVYDITDFFVERAEKIRKINLIYDIVGCKNQADLEDVSIIMYNWLTQKNTINEIIENLMGEISEFNFDKVNNNIPYEDNLCDKSITKYYDDHSIKNGIEYVLKQLVEFKNSNELYWFIDYQNFCLLEMENVGYGYEELIYKLVEEGKIINIFHSKNDYSLKLILLMNKFLPFFLNGYIKFYLADLNPKSYVPIIHVNSDISLVKLPTNKEMDKSIHILSNDNTMMGHTKRLFENLMQKSDPLVEVKDYKCYIQYKNMFDHIDNKNGNYICVENTLPFYSLPKEIALKIDKDNPELNFYNMYQYGNRKFIEILKNQTLHEIISDNFMEKRVILFAGKLIEYSEEDHKRHLEEVVENLKKYDSYNISFTKENEEGTSVTINDIGGLIIEKYNNSKRLIQITDKKVSKEFMRYFQQRIKGSKINDKHDVINYLKKQLETI